MSKHASELYEFGEFLLDVGERKLERLDGKTNGSLPEKAFQTLVHLVRNCGTLLSKDELLSAVWPDAIVEENNLGKAIHTIRHVLGERSAGQRYIETVPKHGYRFVADVRRMPHGQKSTFPPGESPQIDNRHPNILGVPSESLVGSSDRFRNAFEAVQRARIKYCQMTAPTTVEARALISEALHLDPEFAPAYSLSAEVTTLEVIVGLKTPQPGFSEARASIAHAYELGADTSDYYAAAGYVDLIADWDFASAEKKLRKSLSSNPHYGPANRMLGETYMFQGLDEEASFYIERAQVDELTGIHNANILAISHFLGRRYAAVIQVCDRMLALSPHHIIPTWTKCWAFEQMGRLDEAIAGYEKILRLPHGEPALRWAGYAYALAGNRDKALEIAARLEAAQEEQNISPTHAAAIYAALGDADGAIKHIHAGLESREPFMLWIPTDPRFDNLRSDHRFDRVVRQVLAKSEAPVKRSNSVRLILDQQHNDSSAALSAAASREPSARALPVALAAGLIIMLTLGGWFVKSNWRRSEPTVNTETRGAEDPAASSSRASAYDLYVRGKVKVGSENREETEAAIKLLEEAVALNNNFAEAYAQLARGYNTMAFKYSSGSERKRFHENAEVAIEKALTLDPDLAEGHFARGLILWTNTKGFPHQQAIQSYKRSLVLDPNSDETHHQLSLVYSHIGLLDEAHQSVGKALELNPNNTLARFRAGVYYQYQAKFDEAITVFKTIPREHTPLLMDRSLAETLIQSGRLREAENLTENYLRRFPQDEGGSFTSVKALLLAKAGKEKETEELIRRAVEIGSGFGHFHHTAYNVASAYAALNKPDAAVNWLETASDNGFPNYTYFEIDPNLNNIRNHPRFFDFMKKLKPRWERYKALA